MGTAALSRGGAAFYPAWGGPKNFIRGGGIERGPVTTGWIECTLLESLWWFLSSNSGTCEKS